MGVVGGSHEEGFQGEDRVMTSIKYGVYGGLAGGVVFGAMMGMLPMIGSMAGIPTIWAGFLAHLMISAVIGATFAVLVEATGLPSGAGTGLGYGALWWVLGPLTLMPLFMGMGLGVNWNTAAVAQAVPSLVGHLIFGGILGWTHRRLACGAECHHGVHRHADAVKVP